MTTANALPATFREAIAFLEKRGELKRISAEVDPILEIAGIEKALDNGPAFVFENIKGYPGVRAAGNITARMESMAALMGAADHRQLKFKGVQAIRRPVPWVNAGTAPCQEKVITTGIDIMSLMPMLKHTQVDAGRILGGGILCHVDPKNPRDNDLTFRRIHFRGPDWASVMFNPVSHLTRTLRARKGEKLPITINIGVSPAVMTVAGAWALHMIVPDGSDEVGIAGYLQGSPVQLVKAKTVDAWSVADAEWVIEGYLTADRVWESEEGEKLGKPFVTPFFPEWNGYLGKTRPVNKFVATAVTCRADRPYFYTPLAAGYEADNLSKVLRESCFIEFANRFASGLVTDCNIPYGFKVNTGVVYKVKKRSGGDDVLLRNLLQGALNIGMARLVMAVDDDVDIYNSDELWWALTTRANVPDGIQKGQPGASATGFQVAGAPGGDGLIIDATTPFDFRQAYTRGHYPVETVDLKKYFAPDELAKIRATQADYARLLGERGG
jgi:4-hydroxy-3-polyprenylbenzoate decarboxylase